MLLDPKSRNIIILFCSFLPQEQLEHEIYCYYRAVDTTITNLFCIICADQILFDVSKSSHMVNAVLEAANGLQAWKVLEDLNNHVDIVLTEVVTPILSGVGLLCKTMSHKTRKNIPVISKQLLYCNKFIVTI